MNIKKTAAVAVGAGIGAALGKSIKDKKFCPLCSGCRGGQVVRTF